MITPVREHKRHPRKALISETQHTNGGGEAQEALETLIAEFAGLGDVPMEGVLSVLKDHPRGALAASS